MNRFLILFLLYVFMTNSFFPIYALEKKIYYNGKVFSQKELFKYLSTTDLQNLNWESNDYIPFLYDKYNENNQAFKNIISYKEFLDFEYSKLKDSYLIVFSTGMDKQEFVNLYLEVFNTSIDTLKLNNNNNFQRPLEYDKMIDFILNVNNNLDINNLDNSKASLLYILRNYKLFNYGGKINALNKIDEILKIINIDNDISIEMLSIKPDFNKITNIELINQYSILTKNIYKDKKQLEKYFKDIDFKNPLIELFSKFYANILSEEDYILLMRKIKKENYSYENFLVNSDYLENSFLYIKKFYQTNEF